ncbi:MAG: hypothetical protein QM831_34380 [Kofleriaceae bacterium]
MAVKSHRDSDRDPVKRIELTKWGGRRAGAGRPKRGAIASEPHKTRPAIDPRRPLHVTARTTRVISDRKARRAIELALYRSLARSTFRIVHLAIRGRMIELVIEADDRDALARGMQGFQVSAARALNRVHAKTGQVFSDRYRARALITRAAIRALLATIDPSFRRSWPETRLLLNVHLPPPPTRPPQIPPSYPVISFASRARSLH